MSEMAWRRLRARHYISGDYAIIGRPCHAGGMDWRVILDGRQVGLACFLSDAKRDAAAHASQVANGIIAR